MRARAPVQACVLCVYACARARSHVHAHFIRDPLWTSVHECLDTFVCVSASAWVWAHCFVLSPDRTEDLKSLCRA